MQIAIDLSDASEEEIMTEVERRLLNERIFNDANDDDLKDRLEGRGYRCFGPDDDLIDGFNLDEAKSRMIRRDPIEAIRLIERLLPREFLGLSDLVRPA